MAIESIVQSDFSGGIAARDAASDFNENELRQAKGLVLESPTELRTQWNLLDYGTALTAEDLAFLDGFAIVFDGANWRWSPEPDATDPADTASYTTLKQGADNQHAAGTAVYYPADSGRWVDAVVLNSKGRNNNGHVVHLDPATGNPAIHQFGGNYPTGAEGDGTPNMLPRANLSAMWGDFHVLGDIEWAEDPDQPFASDNKAQYPHALWFSNPGAPFTWSQIDVEKMGEAAGGDNRVVGMYPMDLGMLVFTTQAVILLRGDPTLHEFEEQQRGIGPATREAVTWWPEASVALWVAEDGAVWHTDGRECLRIDDELPDVHTGDGAKVGTFGPYALVDRGDGRLWALRRFSGSEGSSGWTELTGVTVGERIQGRASGGWMIDDQERVCRFAPASGRGEAFGVEVEQELTSRVFAVGDEHTKAAWHSFGARLSGGSIVKAEWLSEHGAYLAGGPEALAARATPAWRAGGPSFEGQVKLTLSGDVSVESLTLWVHGGRGGR